MEMWLKTSGRALLLLSALLVSGRPAMAGEDGTARVTVRVRLQDFLSPDGTEPDIRVSAVWYGKGRGEPRSAPLSSSSVFLDLAPGRWSLQAEAPGYWGSPEFLELGSEPREVMLDLWPAGVIEGGFLQTGGEPPPAQLDVFFRTAPGPARGDEPPPSKSACSVEKGPVWRCVVPAGALDLRFQAPGFIPRYRWGVGVPHRGTVHLGKFDLVRGSAVLGWVVTADRSPVGKQARVELRPRMGGALRGRDKAGRLESLTLAAPVNDRGFFQIDGVPPGAYVLEASQPPFAPSRVTVQVLPGEVTEVANPPVVLDLPKVLEVILDPPLDPAGKPWSVELSQLDRNTLEMSRLAATVAGEDGTWKKGGLSQGSYTMRVGSHAGDTWLLRQIEVDGSPSPVYVDLGMVKVAGTVRSGRSPVAAVVTFGGRFGASRITARTDEEGRFDLVLPQAGEWAVHVASEAPPINREIPKVRVEPKPGKDAAEVDLVLPDTLLRGRVVDESNRPLEGAIVNVKTSGPAVEPQVQGRSDQDGRFEFFGLPAGSLLVGAEADGERSSEQVTVRVSDGGEPASVVLQVRAQVRVAGTVISPAGPITGARIKAAPVGIPYFSVRTVTSDAQGRFEVFLPPSAREMFLAVAAPGFAFRMLRLPVSKEREVTVGVEQTAGTLVLESEVPHAATEPEAAYVVVFHQGSLEALPLLSAWALASGEVPESPARSVIPNLEPGDYRACWVLPAERPALDFGVVPQGRCADGFMSANGELTLKLPEPPKPEAQESFSRR